jgi:hypothetical protein
MTPEQERALARAISATLEYSFETHLRDLPVGLHAAAWGIYKDQQRELIKAFHLEAVRELS